MQVHRLFLSNISQIVFRADSEFQFYIHPTLCILLHYLKYLQMLSLSFKYLNHFVHILTLDFFCKSFALAHCTIYDAFCCVYRIWMYNETRLLEWNLLLFILPKFLWMEKPVLIVINKKLLININKWNIKMHLHRYSFPRI